MNINIKKMCTFFPKYFVEDKLCTWWWIGDVRNTVHGVDGMAFFQAFGPLIERHGGTLIVPPLVGLTLRARPRTYATYFRKVCTIESSIRSKALQQSWNPKLRRIKTSFDWAPVPKSWDAVNQCLDFARCKIGRLVNLWRTTTQSVSTLGAWIFLWLPRVERIARNFVAFLLLWLFCASGGFSRVPDAMELSV